MQINNFKDKRVAILGYGKEGRSTLIFLLENGVIDITVLDGNPETIEDVSGVDYIIGDDYLDYLDDFDIIIKSPGISPYNPKILPYKNIITSQTQIFFDNYKGKIIGVTASKGKSTISTLLYKILRKAGKKVKLVGNIGSPVLSEIDLEFDEYDFIIYELSSYMLETLKKKNYISILGNIFPDHLDWHNGFENYKKAKLNIIGGSKINIINSKLDIKTKNTKTFGENGDYSYKNGIFYIGNSEVFTDKGIALKGEHNKQNILSVLAVCDELNIDLKLFKDVLRGFEGLPHRIQKIAEKKGIIFIDDAISTTPESTIEAIKTFGQDIETIFLGGTDRGYDFTELIKYLKDYKIKNIVLFPDTGLKIKKILDSSYNIFETNSMKNAINFAFKNTSKGNICLLSTASPSYSLWKNFEEKGGEFKKYIELY